MWLRLWTEVRWIGLKLTINFIAQSSPAPPCAHPSRAHPSRARSDSDPPRVRIFRTKIFIQYICLQHNIASFIG